MLLRKTRNCFSPLEDETVCKSCGVILENDESSFQNIENTIPYEMLCRTTLNLHQRKQVDGYPHDEQKITSSKFHTHESDQNLLVFSDVCRKLSLNSTVSEDCWTAFTHDKSSLTKAKKMVMPYTKLYKIGQYHMTRNQSPDILQIKFLIFQIC